MSIFVNADVYNNKPRGLQHWLKHSHPPVHVNAVIALLDPDMIFTRPLSEFISSQPNLIYGKYLKPEELLTAVTPGKPAAQLYGLGAPWTIDTHAKFNRTYVCGSGSPCTTVKTVFGERHYAVGPPYIAHRTDMIRIADTWSEFVPKYNFCRFAAYDVSQLCFCRVHVKYPFLLAEMYAYSMAAAHLDLPHQQFEHFMVSNTQAGGEGWPHIDRLPDTCLPPDSQGIYFPGERLPTVIHYCQHFRTGEIAFGKRTANKQMFSCDAPMFVEPPANLSSTLYYWHNGKVLLI
jgi:hypothetical protein